MRQAVRFGSVCVLCSAAILAPLQAGGGGVNSATSEVRAHNVLGRSADGSMDARLGEVAKLVKEPGRLTSRSRDTQPDQQERMKAFVTKYLAFLKTFGIKSGLVGNYEEFAANPFVHQGQVVGLYAVFQQMNSATQGVFSSVSERVHFVVAGIPSGKFTKPRAEVLLAGRVIGNVEIKLPGVGATLVPSLTYLGVLECQGSECRDNVTVR